MIYKTDNIPTIPPLPPSTPVLPNKPVARCGECGRDIFRADMYCCMNDRCPVQTKVVM